MSVLFLGEHDCTKFRHLRLWAERGLVHIEDSRDGSYETISVRAALQRMKGIQDMLINTRNDPGTRHLIRSDDFLEQQRFVEDMIEVCRKAKEQGMPYDASARRDQVRRRPKTFVMPSGGGIL